MPRLRSCTGIRSNDDSRHCGRRPSGTLEDRTKAERRRGRAEARERRKLAEAEADERQKRVARVQAVEDYWQLRGERTKQSPDSGTTHNPISDSTFVTRRSGVSRVSSKTRRDRTDDLNETSPVTCRVCSHEVPRTYAATHLAQPVSSQTIPKASDPVFSDTLFALQETIGHQ